MTALPWSSHQRSMATFHVYKSLLDIMFIASWTLIKILYSIKKEVEKLACVHNWTIKLYVDNKKKIDRFENDDFYLQVINIIIIRAGISRQIYSGVHLDHANQVHYSICLTNTKILKLLFWIFDIFRCFSIYFRLFSISRSFYELLMHFYNF